MFKFFNVNNFLYNGNTIFLVTFYFVFLFLISHHGLLYSQIILIVFYLFFSISLKGYIDDLFFWYAVYLYYCFYK